MNKPRLFRAELVLLVSKYFTPVESGYDIKNVLEDYCHDSDFAEFACDDRGNKLDMVSEATKVLTEENKQSH